MVAVYDEVGFLELVELDRRQVLSPLERPVYALPPLPHARLCGQEGAIEVPPPPHAADDLVHVYDPSPSVEAVASYEAPSSDLVEGEQPVRGVLPSDTGHRRSQTGLDAWRG